MHTSLRVKEAKREFELGALLRSSHLDLRYYRPCFLEAQNLV